jgi:hypothetical protein
MSAEIELKFHCDLSALGSDDDSEVGPRFHRWLPNGEADAVRFDVEGAKVSVWFERRGSTAAGWFVYSEYSQTELDVDIISRQGWLHAGHLLGTLRLSVAEHELQAIERSQLGEAEYVSTGKRLVNILDGAIASFVELLRVKFGQFWLPSHERWDSRGSSLGLHCDRLQMRWRLVGQGEWRRFKPNESSQSVSFRQKDHDDCITESDWRELQNGQLPQVLPLGAHLLARGNELWNLGHRRQAIIESCTALELAIHDRLSKLPVAKASESYAASISAQTSVSQQAWMLGSLTGFDPATLDMGLQAINLRNAIVHEGKDVMDRDGTKLDALIALTGHLLGFPMKRPAFASGNSLEAPTKAR